MGERRGDRAWPVILGYLPAAMAFGAVGEVLHIPWPFILALSLVIYSGALQAAVLGLLSTSTPFLIVVIVAFTINLRHMLYGPHLESQRSDWKWWHRWLMAGFLTDELYALGLNSETATRSWVGMGMGLYASWIVGTVMGMVGIRLVPTSWVISLGVALPALFLGLLIPRVRDRGALWAGVGGAGLALVAREIQTPVEFIIVPILFGATLGFIVSGKRLAP